VTALSPPRLRRAALLALAALACAGLALLPAEAGPLAARAGLAALAVAGAAALLSRRAAAPPPLLRVTARAGLGRATGLALVEVDGRRLLLGVSERSVELLCELGPGAGSRP
jgi:flagellar protein FliO/FliZ